ncbi:MAG: LLM class flavin-dependent oxidoreductase [Candidatus Limnocylindrales bacterium]
MTVPAGGGSANPVLHRLGELGAWSSMEARPVAEQIAYAQRAEALGFGAVWANEISGREPFALLGALVTRTERIGLGLGVASIYARDAAAARAGTRTIAELSGDRFVMGLGVSHRERVEDERGHVYERPLPAMRAYLGAWERAPYTAHPPREEPPLVLAALRDGMLGLAGSRADGAFAYLVPVAYVGRARARLDAAAAEAGRRPPALIVNLPAVAEEDAGVARAAARTYLAGYLRRPAYRANLLEHGLAEADLAGGGSDRLVDALVAWGPAERVGERAAALRAAGADHLVLMPISAAGAVSDPVALEALAGTLLG